MRNVIRIQSVQRVPGSAIGEEGRTTDELTAPLWLSELKGPGYLSLIGVDIKTGLSYRRMRLSFKRLLR